MFHMEHYLLFILKPPSYFGRGKKLILRLADIAK